MNYNLDCTNDFSHQELYTYLSKDTLPDYVKQAELMSKEASDSLDERAFGDRYHRAFPITDKENVYISNAFYMNKKAELCEKWGQNYCNEVESRIKQAAELFGITKDIDDYATNLNEKQASDYTEQCVSTIEQDGQVYELFPFKTAEDLSIHADTFARTIKNYPFSWRQKIATDFVKQAEEQNLTELPDLIMKYAGRYFPDTRIFATELTRRMNKISSAEAKEKLQACIEKSASISSSEDAMNICQEVYTIEKTAGCYDNNNLSTSLGDIVDKTFKLDIEKVADLLNVVTMPNNEIYHMRDLQKISKETYREALGVDVDTTKEAELRDMLPTIPLSDFYLLKELSGIRPL